MKKSKIILIILVLLIVTGAVVLGYMYTHGTLGVKAGYDEDGVGIKVACVGDSVTYGHGISGWPENTYPDVLSKMLGNEYHVVNFGNSGTTVQNDGDQPYTATRQYEESLAFEPNTVVFMLGSNDSKPGNMKDLDTFRKAYEELLQVYIDTGAKIFIASSPEAFFPKGKSGELTSFGICPKTVDEIAEIQREVAEEKGIGFIDIHTLTQAHPEYYISDRVHPNNEGAKAIAYAVFDAISK